jgi:hypothetical protein
VIQPCFLEKCSQILMQPSRDRNLIHKMPSLLFYWPSISAMNCKEAPLTEGSYVAPNRSSSDRQFTRPSLAGRCNLICRIPHYEDFVGIHLKQPQ